MPAVELRQPRIFIHTRESLLRSLLWVRVACAAALFARTGGVGRTWLPAPAVLAALVIGVLLAELLIRRWVAPRAMTGRDWRTRLHDHGFSIGVAILTALALALRLPSLGSDLGHQPIDIDEHRLAANVKHFFVTGELLHETVEHYPGLVFWMFTGSSFLSYLWALMHGAIRNIGDMSVEAFVFAARFTNIIVAAATVGFTCVLGRRLDGSAAGLVGGLIAGIVPLSVQTTTLCRNDPGQVLFVTAAVYAAVASYQSNRFGWPLLAGALSGIATGIKYTSVFALFAALVAVGLRGSWKERLRASALTVSAFVLALGVTNHFLWTDFPNFLRQLSDQVAITGPGHYAASTNPPATHTAILTGFGPGWPILLLAAVYGCYTLAVGRPVSWIYWTFPLLYSWFTTLRPSQFPRWVYPLVPFVSIAGAAALNWVVAALVRPTHRHRGSWTRMRLATAAVITAAILWQPVWSGVVTFSRRLTPQTQQVLEAWLREHAADKVVLLEDHWLDLRGTSVRVQRVPDLAKALRAGLYALSRYDWVVVPETHFGNAALRRLQFVHRIKADQRSFAGNMGYDFEVYATPKLPPAMDGTEIRLDAAHATEFLGPEWPPAEQARPGLAVPVGGASLFLPPVSRKQARVELELISTAPGPAAGSVTLNVGSTSVALTDLTVANGGMRWVAGLVPIAEPSRATEIRVAPTARNDQMRLVRVRLNAPS